MMQVLLRNTIAAACCLVGAQALAQENPARLADCSQITQDAARLACFDRLAAAGRAPTAAATPVAAAAPAVQPAAPATASAIDPEPARPHAPEAADPRAIDSFLVDYWELDQAHKGGTFNFRPHQINYLIANYSYRPNDAPYRPYRRVDPTSGDLSRSELEYQLGFKMKLVENTFNKPLDLWFAYTQNSFWQAGNRRASSPFRETNYQPELMAVAPLHLNLLGVDARFINFGVVHQSNGQASTLSRSWNRAYLQLGLERGPLEVSLRAWKRMHESAQDDNNPDILDYMGRGDLNATYRLNGHEISALLRHNFSTGRGATKLGWAFPLSGPLKGYLQVFSGYGQSLIDYNYYQRSVGAGVMVMYR